MIVGLISDTHGLLRPQAIDALSGVDHIIHAGDVGASEILERLRALAPVTAIRGNVDTALWAEALPDTAELQAGAARIFVVHNIGDLSIDPARAGFQIVVSGHSHKAARSERAGILYINPGSAGPSRFSLPITVARLDLGRKPWGLDFIDLTAAR